ncbi:hypothetical protein ACTMTI_28255 [Nonomuraea sp. H19]|uniref:hypothetical protein n=1 Tax=Nonomuraea sp. H19 TaxID=3452206 RepID=UPI003F89790A
MGLQPPGAGAVKGAGVQAAPRRRDADALLFRGPHHHAAADPERERVVANARDRDGHEVAAGSGGSADEALRGLAGPPRHPDSSSAG